MKVSLVSRVVSQEKACDLIASIERSSQYPEWLDTGAMKSVTGNHPLLNGTTVIQDTNGQAIVTFDANRLHLWESMNQR